MQDLHRFVREIEGISIRILTRPPGQKLLFSRHHVGQIGRFGIQMLKKFDCLVWFVRVFPGVERPIESRMVGLKEVYVENGVADFRL